ncbi:MAG TPA: DUF192 domain-containing protein [Gammaproteobacteria bacterium]
MKSTVPGFLLALLLATTATRAAGPQPELPTAQIRVDGVPLTVEVADDEREREHGLMFRSELADGRGMLFVYPRAGQRAFWMRNTPLPLDLGYADADGTLFELHQLEPHSLRPVPSGAPARYVLEVPRGWFARHRLGPGARLELGALAR